jgi:hypothetical protein
MPCAEDAKGLIKAAERSKDPVIFLEHEGLYRRVQTKTPEPDADYIVPFGKGVIRREGKALTVVTWGSTVYMALELARQMDKDGISLEVIDLRSIVPLDEDLIYQSVRRTSRVMIAHEDTLTAGFGAEVAARIAENCIGSLDGPVVRVAAKDTFVPSAPNLELAVLPSVAGLRLGAEKALAFWAEPVTPTCTQYKSVDSHDKQIIAKRRLWEHSKDMIARRRSPRAGPLVLQQASVHHAMAYICECGKKWVSMRNEIATTEEHTFSCACGRTIVTHSGIVYGTGYPRSGSRKQTT